MKKHFVMVVVILLFASGCATKSKFVYESSQEGLENNRGKMVAAVVHMVDERTDAANFDKFYEGKPAEDIQRMLEYELLRTDLFKAVIPVDYPAVRADFIIEPTLINLQSQVPDLDMIRLKTLILSCISFAVSSVYNLTDTEVYGESGIHMHVTDGYTGKVILDKSYSGMYKRDVSKLKCDLAETKVLVAQRSILNAIETIKSDITQALGNKGKDVAPLESVKPGRFVQENIMKVGGAMGREDQGCGDQVIHADSDLFGISTFVPAIVSVSPCIGASHSHPESQLQSRNSGDALLKSYQ